MFINKRPMGLYHSPFSPSKLFEGFCYTREFILRNLNLLAPRILHVKYQCMPIVYEKKIFEDLLKFSLFSPFI